MLSAKCIRRIQKLAIWPRVFSRIALSPDAGMLLESRRLGIRRGSAEDHWEGAPLSVLTPFHLAIQVRDIDEARDFYGTKLGLPQGRSDATWIDWNMFGHQVVTHLNPTLGPTGKVPHYCNPVDAHAVPTPHFGVVLQVEDWKTLAERVRGFVDEFVIEPYVRFEGLPGEQHTMFFTDPSGNALEFKAFANIESELFSR